MPDVLHVTSDRPEGPAVERALSALREGRLLIYPTDTLYALGGRALDPAAGEAVRSAKGRGEDKPLPLVAADAAQAQGVAAAWPEAARRLAAAFWPGPLTLVLLARETVPLAVTAGTGTLAIRVPALELPRRLARAAGPLISTSANLSGQPPPLTCAQAVAQVGSAAALALDGGPGRPTPSTIVDLAGGEPRLLRAGALDWERVRRLLS